MKKIIMILSVVVVILVAVLAVNVINSNDTQTRSTINNENTNNNNVDNNDNAIELVTTPDEIPQEEVESEVSSWKTTELKDVATGAQFKISDFNKPVIVESFAVWCPKCTSQQRDFKELKEEIGDEVVLIGLNTDPNEDESAVLNHIQKNGFDWYYAVSPTDVTQSLIDEFGVGIVNAPSVPKILICPNGDTRKLSSGGKNAEELKKEIDTCG